MFDFIEKPLSKKEEQELIKNAKNREELEAALIKHNFKMVLKCAHQYKNKNNFEDLVQEGAKGLAIAATRFDTERGIKFNSFAIWYVKKYIFEFINKEVKQNINDIPEEYDELDFDAVNQNMISLDGTLTTKDLNSIERTYEPADCNLQNYDYSTIMSEAMHILSEDEYYIIKNRFAKKHKTLKELGKIRSYSLSNIKAIETKALNKLKSFFKARNLNTYTDVLAVVE